MSDKPKLAKRRRIRKAELLEICERQLEQLRHEGDIVAMATGINFSSMSKSGLLFWLKWFGVCEYSGEKINKQQIDFDHKIPIAMQYEGDPIEWQVILRKWHKIKTTKDVKDIAKAKRMAGETGQYVRRQRRKEAGKLALLNGRSSFGKRPFPKAPEDYKHFKSNGFSKTHKRKFDGTVERRDT